MICTEIWNGQGMGNQLHSMIATRIRALDLGVDFGIAHPERFKGSQFLDFDFGKEVVGGETLKEGDIPLTLPIGISNYYREKEFRDSSGVDIRGVDPEFFFIEDNTKLEGLFQSEQIWEHREQEVNEWLKVEPLEMPDDLCVIGYRGGEFSIYPDLFLTPEYWTEGIRKMREINPNMRFEVHTDDRLLALSFFNGDLKMDIPVIHDIGLNWRSMRYAKYAIIANSSFGILPRWLNKGITIAPRFWGRRNTKVWSLPQNFTKRFTYL